MAYRVGVTYSIPRKVESYADAVRLAGLEPVLIAPGAPLSITGCDGLVLTGGTDIDPARYGEAPDGTSSEPDPARDELEAILLAQASDTDLPVLAICRGLQMLNVVRRGTLKQDIPGHKVKDASDVHTISIKPGTKLAAIVGDGELSVNSRHHQAVGRLGEGLIVSARALDGTIEGLEDPDKRFLVAVQWHPEERVETHLPDRTLFAAFADACMSVTTPISGDFGDRLRNR